MRLKAFMVLVAAFLVHSGAKAASMQRPNLFLSAQELRERQLLREKQMLWKGYRTSSQGEVMEDELDEQVDPKEVEEVMDRATRLGADRSVPIIPQYRPDMLWAWRTWRGTILENTWAFAVVSMLAQLLICLYGRTIGASVSVIAVPDPDHSWVKALKAIMVMWSYQLTFTTFVTTFFVGHAHSFWRNAYELARKVQGRMNDISLLTATHAARAADGKLNPDAQAMLNELARNLRLFHVLFWSDVVYRRTRHFGASFRVLLSETGLEGMQRQGMVTQREAETLIQSGLPGGRWHLCALEWVMARLAKALKGGLIEGGVGFEQVLLEQCCLLRGVSMGIPDELACRMPLAYVHFAHLLVDTLLIIAPFALYPSLGIWAVPMSGILALFFRGLLELSKSFLDPFGNRRMATKDFCADVVIDVLIGESNAGSVLWPQAATVFPFDERDFQPNAAAGAYGGGRAEV